MLGRTLVKPFKVCLALLLAAALALSSSLSAEARMLDGFVPMAAPLSVSDEVGLIDAIASAAESGGAVEGNRALASGAREQMTAIPEGQTPLAAGGSADEPAKGASLWLITSLVLFALVVLIGAWWIIKGSNSRRMRRRV
jgi:hypothetical protein